MSDGGKGSAPRPFSVDQATFASHWDAIFSETKESQELMPHGVKVTCPALPWEFPVRVEGGAATPEDE